MVLIRVALAWIATIAAATASGATVTAIHTRNSFRVFWNVPSFSCHKFGIKINVSSTWGIVQNAADAFRGEQLAILYDPGNFPALIKDSSGKQYDRNGGVPQEGNLTTHLQALVRYVDRNVADRNFSGLGVIDMESWRPVFRQLFGSFSPYVQFSYDIEKRKHPRWSKYEIETTARARFEAAAREFMETSLELVRQMRPLGQWGYYAFPYCFNWKEANCPQNVQTENDRIQWLFDESNAIYPSIYLGESQAPSSRSIFIRGRLQEARRMAQKTRRLQSPDTYAYIRYNYHDTKKFLSSDDLYNSIAMPKELQLSGVVVWGSSSDVNTKEKCQALQEYVNNVLGPISRNVTDISNIP